jgi:adenine phosphoribosyltransferase
MYEEHLKFYPGFPKEGINFVDVIPLMQDKNVFNNLIEDLGKLVTASTIAAPEARGFLFAAPIMVKCPNVTNMIPLRKKGKLPSTIEDLNKVTFMKEYGEDALYFRTSDLAAGKKVNGIYYITVLDDILASGGTAKAIAEGLERVRVNGCPVKVKEFVFLAELDDLKGADRLKDIAPVKSLIHLNEK